jgi:hypothetical protein
MPSDPRQPAADDWVGGLVTPSPVPVTENPLTLPLGDSVPTGIVIDGYELVLYFWGGGQYPHLDEAWHEVSTGRVTNEGRHGTAYLSCEAPFRDLRQLTWNYTVVDCGAISGPVARVTSTFAGRTIEAKFTRWSADPAVTIFWMRGHGGPIPKNVPVGDGHNEPLDPSMYPLISAYDDTGKVIAENRLRPPATGPRV